MSGRPYVLLSCAMSVDGRLDAPGPGRLVLSGRADLDRVDAERAAADAIMVGAGTIRRDDPRLLIRSPQRRAERVARGVPPHPARITLTASGALDPRARFFTHPEDSPDPEDSSGAGPARASEAGPARAPRETEPGPARALRAPEPGPARAPGAGGASYVYCPPSVSGRLRAAVNGRARVIGLGSPLRLESILADLAARGIRRLMVEGGASLGSQLLSAGLVDELHLVVAPFFVGDSAAPRFAPAGRYPHGPGRPMVLADVRRLDGDVLLRYLLDPRPDSPGSRDG